MGKINAGRVIVGGIIAGACLILGNFWLGMQLQSEWIELGRRQIVVAPGPASVVWSYGAQIAVGMLVAWLYAALRPRFGGGPRTAILVGFMVWCLVWGYSMVWQLVYLPMVCYSPAISLAMVNLVACVIGAWLAGWVYREGTAASRRRRRSRR